ncbi:MAG TPA: hypothetical protein VFD45_00495 [Patescibacteria group bacterium]|nr:hypothetical protein [Patescibacteria group bacterium]
MKFNLFKAGKRVTRRTISDYKQELLLKQGTDQLKKLVEKGLSIPVAFL